jgi:hypothetical protein
MLTDRHGFIQSLVDTSMPRNYLNQPFCKLILSDLTRYTRKAGFELLPDIVF